MPLGPDDLVLVTGATGFTGRVLVRQLCERGCRVRAIARASSNRAGLDHPNLEWATGEVYDSAIVAAAARDVHYVFHVAAAYREAKIADEVYERVHVTSTQLLADAVIHNVGFKRFIHVSTVGVLGHIEHPPADETAPYNPGDVYQRTKADAERWLLDYAPRAGLPFTIVRPAAIYGPGDRRLLKIFRFAKLPVAPLIGFTRGLYHLIHVEDLAAFMILAADHPRALGEIFICGNPEPTSIREIVATVARHLGREPRFLRLPAAPFFAAAAACETVCKPLGIEPPIYPRREAFFTKDRAFDTSKMRALTGFDYRYTNESGLKATADAYRAQGWL
jgi:nucleoside-diphosphate-sugar epimerase